jgi:tricarballylate dehydrogenase
MEVQPAITFTFTGLHADPRARVLDTRGNPIPGLLAAGVDVGVYHSVYAGGLAFGLVTGMTAAKTALAVRQPS